MISLYNNRLTHRYSNWSGGGFSPWLTESSGGGEAALLPDFKWTNNYIAGAGGVQTLVADIGGVNFVQNTTTQQPQDGGNKLEFDGANDFMTSGTSSFGSHNLFMSAGNPFTLAVKFFYNIATGSGYIISRSGSVPGDRLFAIVSQVGNISFKARGDTTTLSVSLDNVMRTVFVVWDGVSTALAYVDGISEGALSVGTASEDLAINLQIGNRFTVDAPADCDIFEARIYNQELDASQVLTAFNEMNP